MLKRILAPFADNWQGQPVRVTLGNETFLLGQGTPRTHVTIHTPSVLRHFLRDPAIGFAEAYMRGDITIEGNLQDVLRGYYTSDAVPSVKSWQRLRRVFRGATNAIGVSKAISNAQHHYDLGNDFYTLWLDPSLVYSCAYYAQKDDTLVQAQQQKLELLCRKVLLHPGQTLLDIGCGWGALLLHAAEKYGAHVTGITPVEEQAAYIREQVAKRGLQDRVTLIVGDWRQLQGQYDRIVSVGMFEHVGQQQYAEFFAKWKQLLAPGGISLLHTIGAKGGAQNSWINKYIFPGGYLPDLSEITAQAARHALVITDIENLWQHYARTLADWSANFTAVRDKVVAMHGEEFARMWWLYLQSSEVGFTRGDLYLWQVVLLPGKQDNWPLNREIGTNSLR